jgi:hypothetical protein
MTLRKGEYNLMVHDENCAEAGLIFGRVFAVPCAKLFFQCGCDHMRMQSTYMIAHKRSVGAYERIGARMGDEHAYKTWHPFHV